MVWWLNFYEDWMMLRAVEDGIIMLDCEITGG
jgi:hypothetical protein